MTDGKVEFGSDAWLEALGQNLTELAAAGGADLDGQRVRICEIVTDPPARLADPSRADGSRAWSIMIDGRKAAVAPVEISDADFGSISDYNSILTLARWVYTDDPREQAEVERHRAALERAGAFKTIGQRPTMSPAMSGLLRELHNRLARITA